jgi:hypothetical protein
MATDKGHVGVRAQLIDLLGPFSASPLFKQVGILEGRPRLQTRHRLHHTHIYLSRQTGGFGYIAEHQLLIASKHCARSSSAPTSASHSPEMPPKNSSSTLKRRMRATNMTPFNYFHDCSLLDRTSLPNHDMSLKREKIRIFFKWKNNTKGTLSESQQKKIIALFRGNQFAESWMEHRESLLNSSTGRLVTTRLSKPRRQDC